MKNEIILTKRQKAEKEQYEADKKKWAEEDRLLKEKQDAFLRQIHSILKG